MRRGRSRQSTVLLLSRDHHQQDYQIFPATRVAIWFRSTLRLASIRSSMTLVSLTHQLIFQHGLMAMSQVQVTWPSSTRSTAASSCSGVSASASTGKCNLRPNFVPGQLGDSTPLMSAHDYSNRRPIFRVTGTGFFYGFTFIDKLDYEKTHHLLDTFSFTGRNRADTFYQKILSSFGAHGGISSTFTRTRDSEVVIVAPAPAPGTQTIDTDGVSSASPYIYNCSIRSKYGMCAFLPMEMMSRASNLWLWRNTHCDCTSA